MSWRLVKSIQLETDLRLILPFGLQVRLGDVISVDKNANFTLQGTCVSVLGRPAGKPRPDNRGGVDLLRQSGKGTAFKFRSAATASTLFPELPKGKAGFDISFGSANGWVLAITGREITSLDNVDRFRRPILDAYRWKVWKPDWALVTSVATTRRMTLIASRTNNTKVALALGGMVAPTAALSVKFTANASIMATTSEIIQCITSRPMVTFCSAIRVQDPWWRFWSGASVGSLAARKRLKDPIAAPYKDFWEDVDS